MYIPRSGPSKGCCTTNIHTTLIQSSILTAGQAVMLLGKKKKKEQKDKSSSLLICISPHCLNPVLMQTTKLRLSDYTGTLGYYTGQEQPDMQEFLFALSNLLNIQQVKKLTLSHFCSSQLLQRYEHKPTSQSTLGAVSCYQAQPVTHCWG